MATTAKFPGSDRDQQKKAIVRQLRKSPKTAGEIATAIGYSTGQAISRPLGELVKSRQAKTVEGRPTRYVKP